MFLNTNETSLVEDEVGGVLGFGSGGEDGLAVTFENLQPLVDVFRMMHVLKRNAGMGTQEGRADFGNQFLEGITKVAKLGTTDPV